MPLNLIARRKVSTEGDELSSMMIQLEPMVKDAAAWLVEELKLAEQLSDGFRERDMAIALVDRALSDCRNRLSTAEIWGPSNRGPSHWLWDIAGPWLKRGWLQTRAREKPRGYPGDYELLARMIENRLCEDPLGAALDHFFQNQGAPAAVRRRTQLVASEIARERILSPDGPFVVTSVGCGPAFDVRRGLAMLPAKVRKGVEVRLIDLDPAALDYASLGLANVVEPDQIHILAENAIRRPPRPLFREFLQGSRIIICTGLCDYLSDEEMSRFLRLLWNALAPGGLLLVGNFAPNNPTRAYMEWVGNWYLSYRSEDDMQTVASAADIPSECSTIVSEPLGINLFLEARKPG